MIANAGSIKNSQIPDDKSIWKKEKNKVTAEAITF